MKLFILAALAGTILLSGCASDGSKTKGEDVAERSYTPVGTYIPRKSSDAAGKATTVDKQALENERTMNNGAINLPQR
jgi:lactam utilization protein B